MLAKKTSKNQLTLPKEIVKKFPGVEYFDVSVEGQKIILTPVVMKPLSETLEGIRDKMERLGLKEADVLDAVRWARKKKSR